MLSAGLGHGFQADNYGAELCRKMIEKGPDTKVIFMTAYAKGPHAAEATQAGASDYLFKPFEPDSRLIATCAAEKHLSLE